MITENDFYFVLKDIALSLRDISKSLNGRNYNVCRDIREESVRGMNESIGKMNAEEERKDEVDIGKIMKEEPTDSEMSLYMSKRMRERSKGNNRPKKTYQKDAEKQPRWNAETPKAKPHKVPKVLDESASTASAAPSGDVVKEAPKVEIKVEKPKKAEEETVSTPTSSIAINPDSDFE